MSLSNVLAELVEIDTAVIAAEKDISGTRANIILRKIRRHQAAELAAPKYGLIGVGIISFADARLARFTQRIERLNSAQKAQ